MRQALGHPADLVVGDPQHLPYFGKRTARFKCRKAADHRGICRTVLGEDKVDHVVLAVVRKIDVDVRQLVHLHPFTIEEAAEIQLETHGADIADAQAVANQRIGGTPTGNPVDAFASAILEQVPDREKIVLVTDLTDH